MALKHLLWRINRRPAESSFIRVLRDNNYDGVSAEGQKSIMINTYDIELGKMAKI